MVLPTPPVYVALSPLFNSAAAPVGAPVNTAAPAITGQAFQGFTVSCSAGSWTNSPTSFTYQWRRSGNDIGGATSNTYALTSSDVSQSIDCRVTAMNSGGSSAPATSNTITPTTAPVTGTIEWGWDPTFDLGTTGDYFVDAVNGSNSNNGTSVGTAKQTINAANALATSGDIIKVRSGTYREAVSCKGGVTYEGYGTEKPILTAANALTGWTQITGSTDSARLGATLSASGNIWKYSGLAKTLICDSLGRSLNIFENGQRLIQSTWWEGGDLNDKFWGGNSYDYWNSISVGVTSAGGYADVIDNYTDTRPFALFTDAQLNQGRILGHRSNNSGFGAEITSVDRAANIIYLEAAPAPDQRRYESNHKRRRYCIRNLGPALQQGQWFFWDNGATVDIYIWPYSASVGSSTIEYTARTFAFNTNEQSNVTIRGFDLRQSGGTGSREGALIVDFILNTWTDGLVIEQNRLSGIQSGIGEAITLQTTRNCKIHHNTFEDLYGQGIGLFGDVNKPIETTEFSNGNDIQYNYFERCTGGALRIWTQDDTVVAYNKGTLLGYSAHANKPYPYEQATRVLFWGNIWPESDGYASSQEASRCFWMFNFMVGIRDVSQGFTCRAFVDQNNGTTPPANWPTPYNPGPSVVANNTFFARPNAQGANNAMNITNNSYITSSANSNVTWVVQGNITHGYAVPAPSQIDLWQTNCITSSIGAYTGNGSSLTDIEVPIADLVDDPDVLSGYTIQSGSAVRSATSASLTSIMTYVQAQFGDRVSEWVDPFGNAINFNAPPYGCCVDFDDYAVLRGAIPDLAYY